jgi:FkbM family methyltransferase
MISSKFFPSYAQYNEDLILLALLYDIEKGFYVDVGANYPIIDSVTYLFYKKGWHGLNIEPIPSLHKQLQKARPKDINLQIGIGSKQAKLNFYESESVPGHSSFVRSEIAEDDVKEYEVEVKNLEQVFTENKVNVIHFLKIDVEGYEAETIKGNNWERFRPLVVCIEANHRKQAWQKDLIAKGYRVFINDGLNEYYIAKEQWSRTEGFAERAIQLSYHALRQHQYESWEYDSKELEKVTRLNQKHYELVQSLSEHSQHLEKSSLYNKSYARRIKTSLYELTIGWYKYLRAKKNN